VDDERSPIPAVVMACLAALVTLLRWLGHLPLALDDGFYVLVLYLPTALLFVDWALSRFKGSGP